DAHERKRKRCGNPGSPHEMARGGRGFAHAERDEPREREDNRRLDAQLQEKNRGHDYSFLLRAASMSRRRRVSSLSFSSFGDSSKRAAMTWVADPSKNVFTTCLSADRFALSRVTVGI